MNLRALSMLILVALSGSVQADIPKPRADGSYGPPDELKTYGPIAAGVGIAIAVAIGGTMAVRHLRDQKDTAPGVEGVDPPAGAEKK